MAKNISKKSFIQALQFHLSFYFTDTETADIINDYEEWFGNEALEGKSEKEICDALTPPRKIVRNLLAEANTDSKPKFILFQNTPLQVILLGIIHLLCNLLLSRLCSSSSMHYLYFALGTNFLYFFIGTVLIKKSDSFKPRSYKSNLPITGLAAFIILFEIFFLPKLTGPNSGKICVIVLNVILFILFSTSLYFALKKSSSDKQLTFLTTLHICGVLTLLLFVINQLHALYSSTEEYVRFIYNSIGIYAETVILCCAFHFKKMCTKESI